MEEKNSREANFERYFDAQKLESYSFHAAEELSLVRMRFSVPVAFVLWCPKDDPSPRL